MPKDGRFSAPSLDRIVKLGPEGDPGEFGPGSFVTECEVSDRDARTEVERALGAPFVSGEISILTRYLPGNL